MKLDNKYTNIKKTENEYTLRLPFKTHIRREHKMNAPYAFLLKQEPSARGEADSHIKKTGVLFFTITQNTMSQLLSNVNFYSLFIIR